MKYFKILIAIAICQSAGLLGTLFTMEAIPTWYTTLNKPSFNPPSWIFGPVWTLLYALMGYSLYRVWTHGWKSKKVILALSAFAVQLFLNAWWSVIFFGMRNPEWALVEIVVMWMFIVFTVLSFYKVDKLAAWLLVPYLAWVTFAAYLNYTIWTLNMVYL